MILSFESLLCRFTRAVLTALNPGMPRSRVVTTFQVNLASLKRWQAARRDTGDFAPQPPTGGFEPTVTPEQHHQLRAQVAAFPDATLAEHATRWNAAHATTLSQWTLGRTIRLLGLTRKKSLIASERDAWERARFLLSS